MIMAGGAGERFWPLSRPERPKQLLPFGAGGRSLLEEAVERARPLFGEHLYVSTGRETADPILASEVVPRDRLLVEPARRNTLGALVWTTACLLAKGKPEATLAVLTADHYIGDPDRFRALVALALDVAEHSGGLVTLGIRPTRPETGYGYIEAGEPLTSFPGAFKVRQFREKPGIEQAREFLEAGRFFWNSGMFFWTVPAFMSELRNVRPECSELIHSIAQALGKGDEDAAAAGFHSLPGISIDYALMECASHVFVVEADFPWDDLGAWDALARVERPDGERNVARGDCLLMDAKDCVVFNETPGTVVAVQGVEGLVVVVTPDAALVCPKDRAQDVRKIVERLRKEPTEPS